MRKLTLFAVAVLAVTTPGVAHAGCVSGALKGAVVGHFMHHPVAGAAVGCAAGAHNVEAERQASASRIPSGQPIQPMPLTRPTTANPFQPTH